MDALSRALQLDEAERGHLFALARSAEPGSPTPPHATYPTRFVYLEPAAREFFVDWDRVANDAAALLRLEAGRNPHDRGLIQLVGELSTRSEVFRRRWASHDVQFHRNGRKGCATRWWDSWTWTSTGVCAVAFHRQCPGYAHQHR